MKNLRFTALLLLAVVLLAACAPITAPSAPAAAPAVESAEAAQPAPLAGRLVLATTTSTQDSGLLDDILPDFEAQTGVPVDVIAVGSGQAMKIGEDGNADVLLVHSPSAEQAFMDAGHGTRRDAVMYNDFVIIGPASDPAAIKGMTSAADALAQLASTESTFISRGDDSGTHAKEKGLWSAAAIEPAGDWYVSAGQGMGAVITMANEQQAYTLSDRSTYLARTLEGLDLEVIVEGDPALFNPYSVITVDPAKNPNIQGDLANQFADWIISVPAQELISQFGVEEFGEGLFLPDSAAWNSK
jgi:tungstate transport system substrate-binding protein